MSDADQPVLTRRKVIGATVGMVGLAGCSGSGGDDAPTDTTEDGGGSNGTGGTTSSGDDSPGPAVTNLSPADCEGEMVSGDITTDTTWSVGECPKVVLNGAITVAEGATLTIEPGVEVVGNDGNTPIEVVDGSTLEVSGDPANPVWFHAQNMEPGGWKGIVANRESTVTLDNAVLEHGAAGNGGILVLRETTQASITNCLFRHSNNSGIRVYQDATLTEFASNAFRENNRAAVHTGADHLGALDSVSSYVGGNNLEGVLVRGGGTVESEGTWPGALIHLKEGPVTVAASVSVESGARIVGRGNAGIALTGDGSFTAEGDSDAPIRFEGATAEPGHWQGIKAEGAAKVTLSNVVVADGGGGNGGNLTLRGTSTATVTDSTFRRSNKWGIFVGEDASLEASNNTFENNGEGGIGGPGA